MSDLEPGILCRLSAHIKSGSVAIYRIRECKGSHTHKVGNLYDTDFAIYLGESGIEPCGDVNILTSRGVHGFVHRTTLQEC